MYDACRPTLKLSFKSQIWSREQFEFRDEGPAGIAHSVVSILGQNSGDAASSCDRELARDLFDRANYLSTLSNSSNF
jgi:hypothetical protein